MLLNFISCLRIASDSLIYQLVVRIIVNCSAMYNSSAALTGYVKIFRVLIQRGGCPYMQLNTLFPITYSLPTHIAPIDTQYYSYLTVSFVQDLLGKLLRRAVKNRLGNLSGGPGDIINSPWYSTYTRDAFLAKRIEVPWVPIVTGAADASKYTPHPDDGIHGTAKAPKVDSSLWDADW